VTSPNISKPWAARKIFFFFTRRHINVQQN